VQFNSLRLAAQAKASASGGLFNVHPCAGAFGAREHAFLPRAKSPSMRGGFLAQGRSLRKSRSMQVGGLRPFAVSTLLTPSRFHSNNFCSLSSPATLALNGQCAAQFFILHSPQAQQGKRRFQMAIYFGGSRSLLPSIWLRQVVSAVVAAGQVIHVGCQFGADQQVVSACPASSLVVFAVESASFAPTHVYQAVIAGAQVHFQAGGSSAPVKVRYLLRSLAAACGCECALFFSPGCGSLAVASRLVGQMPVYAFGNCPSAIPHQAGQWVRSSFMGFSCWQWSAAQQAMF
jgi:hypothetical protein